MRKIKLKINILLIIGLFAYCEGISQTRVQVNIPSVESESNYVWRTIRDIKFFEQNNYLISLPKGALIESLKSKSRYNNLSDEDFESLKIHMRDSVYNKIDYQKGYAKIESELALINKMIVQLDESERNWDFKTFDTYHINLTLYGPGGSYNPNKGTILIYTSPKGDFKQYDNPANTIIHEIVHIGIEESIVSQFKIPHRLKERIVDNYVLLCFKGYLPNYRMQNMGDNRIDPYLKQKIDLKDLSEFVAEIMKEK